MSIHSMFGKFIQSLFFKNALLTKKECWSPEEKKNGNNIIHLRCQAIKKTLVNIS